MEKKYNYTYQIKNLINGKTYIGVHSTDDLNDGYMGSGIQLKPAYEKYGKENFVKTIMCFFDTMEEMYEEEKFLVDEKWIQKKDTYNISLGGNGGNFGEEVNKKISEALKGKKHYMYGKKLSEEQKQKISKSLLGNKRTLGYKQSEEQKQKKSKSLKKYYEKNKSKTIGRKHTEETKEKISQKSMGRKHTEETKEKLRELNTGKNNPMYGKNPSNKNQSKYNNIKHLVKQDIKNGIPQSQIQKKYNISKGGVYRISLELK